MVPRGEVGGGSWVRGGELLRCSGGDLLGTSGEGGVAGGPGGCDPLQYAGGDFLAAPGELCVVVSAFSFFVLLLGGQGVGL